MIIDTDQIWFDDLVGVFVDQRWPPIRRKITRILCCSTVLSQLAAVSRVCCDSRRAAKFMELSLMNKVA